MIEKRIALRTEEAIGCVARLLACLLLVASNLVAEIPVPDTIVYGTITVDGQRVSTGNLVGTIDRDTSGLEPLEVVAELRPHSSRLLAETEVAVWRKFLSVSLADVLAVRRDSIHVRLRYLESLREVMQAWAFLSPYLEEI